MSKELIDQFNASLAAFREANDKALAEKADKGRIDVLLQEKVDKANSDVGALMEKIQARQDELERRLEVDPLHRGAGAQSDEAIRAELTKYAPEFGRVITLEEHRAHKAAFLAFARTGDVQAALKIGSNPDGGYLVPVDTSGRIITRRFESSPIRQIAGVQSTTRESIEGLTDRDEAGAGWVGETGTRDETDTPEVGKYKVEVEEMYCEPKATQRVIDDAATDIEAWLSAKIADKLARLEATAFVTGDGIEKPRGFTTYTTAATADDSRTWGHLEHVTSGTSGVVTADELVDLVFKLKPEYLANARFVLRRATEAALRKLKDGDGNYLWQPNFEARTGRTLLGHGVTNAEDMPAVAANALAIAFGDFMQGYLIVDRLGMRTLRDPYTSKGWVKFYTTARVGGAVVDFDAIKFLKIAA